MGTLSAVQFVLPLPWPLLGAGLVVLVFLVVLLLRLTRRSPASPGSVLSLLTVRSVTDSGRRAISAGSVV
jgi:hypothetical protein